MRTFTLNRTQRIARPVEEVFDFFSRPENLAEITPSNLGFKMLTPIPLEMRVGTVIDHAIRVMGVRIHWRAIITGYNPPFGFIDEQLRGPYAFWHHRHIFKPDGEGTVIEDHVTYALGYSFVGNLLNAIFVRGQLNRIFDYRAATIKRIFDNGAERENRDE